MKFGSFEVVRELAVNRMAVVYLARDTTVGRLVVLKQVTAAAAKDERSVERFLNEARLMADVRDPHVAILHSVFLEDGRPILVIEHLEGGSLEEAIAQRDLTVEESTQMMIDVLSGLVAIHDKRLIHRDIKPGNVLSNGSGRWKVADFGISLAAGTRPTAVQGTAQYLAPESLMPPYEFDQRIDLYALGMTAYETLVGKQHFKEVFGPLFEGGAAAADHKWMNWTCDMRASAPPAHEISQRVPTIVSDLVSRMLAKDPAARLASAAEGLAILQGSSGGGPGPSPRRPPVETKVLNPPSQREPAAGRGSERRGRSWRVPAAAVASLLVLGLAGLLWANGRVEVSVVTEPAGATAVVGQATFQTSKSIKIKRFRDYSMTLSKPGYVTGQFVISARSGPEQVFTLKPKCADDDGLAWPARVRLDGLSPELETRVSGSFDFLAIVGKGCACDGVLKQTPQGLVVGDSIGEVLSDPVPVTDGATSALRERLESLHLLRLLQGPSHSGGSGSVELVLATGDATEPRGTSSFQSGIDAMSIWLRTTGLTRVLVLDVNPLGQLFVLYPHQKSNGNVIEPGRWHRLASYAVSPPKGKDRIIAIAYASGSQSSPFDSLERAYPKLWNWPTGVESPVVFASSGSSAHGEARRFAGDVSKVLGSGGGWARATATCTIR